ncbi:MAG: tripartite tricarboxylate transporter substrate binding protein [Streptosporangiales bacterium]|nr:tripartite tricarboxylate transporter substrate binding protein [Streptosporangiales bacterium]
MEGSPTIRRSSTDGSGSRRPRESATSGRPRCATCCTGSFLLPDQRSPAAQEGIAKVRIRFPVLALAASAAVVLAGCGQGPAAEGGAAAKNYPNKQIQYVIPFDPGGESDVTARLQQKALERELGQSVVVSNKPGGGGAVAWAELANQTRPDGYTIMGANLPHIVLQPRAQGDPGYRTEDIKWAYLFESTPGALIVAKDSPYKTIDDFVKAAEEKPGKLTVGGSAKFSANHMGMLALNDAAGIKTTYVPFSGTATVTPALLGGEVDAIMSYNTAALELEDEGVRVLGFATEERLSQFPDVPTFRESGYDVINGAWRGVAVPPDTPDAIVDKIAAAFRKVNKDPEVVKKMEDLGFEIVDMGPEEAAKFTQERAKVEGELLDRFGLAKQ